jgi:hypothetical protein
MHGLVGKRILRSSLKDVPTLHIHILQMFKLPRGTDLIVTYLDGQDRLHCHLGPREGG